MQKLCFSWKFSCSRTPASPASHQGHWLEPGVFRWVSQVAAITWSHDPQTGLNRWDCEKLMIKGTDRESEIESNTGKTRKTRRKERQGRQIPKRLCAWKYLFINQKKNWQNEIRGCYIFCCCRSDQQPSVTWARLSLLFPAASATIEENNTHKYSVPGTPRE